MPLLSIKATTSAKPAFVVSLVVTKIFGPFVLVHMQAGQATGATFLRLVLFVNLNGYRFNFFAMCMCICMSMTAIGTVDMSLFSNLF